MLSVLLALYVQSRTLNVSAAASLREALTTISKRYEAMHPGVRVRLNFGGSQTLASQINQGAPADVFASAAEKNLRDIRFEPDSYRIFAFNRLEIAVRKNLIGIRTVKDLAKAERLVVADPAVPVGAYTNAFLDSAGKAYGDSWLTAVRSKIVSRELDVKSVLAKVRLGEADAGIVYVSDVVSVKGQINEAPIPSAFNQTAEYPVAIPTFAENRDEGKRFIKFLLSSDSQLTLEQCGFTSPEHPVRSILIGGGGKATHLLLPPSPTLARVTVQATDDKKHTASYTGVLVSGLPGLERFSVATFVGADRYTQTISTAELKSRRAVLVRNADGNYQIIVPGLKPSAWVNWLRRIELR